MDHNVLATQITMGGVGVAFLQWLKSTKFFPWVTAESAKLNRILAAAVALVSAVGIHLSWQSAGEPGAYTLTITGATLTGVTSMAWIWLKQFVVQEFMYRATANGSSSSSSPAPAAKG
jgi:hypothetical protein